MVALANVCAEDIRQAQRKRPVVGHPIRQRATGTLNGSDAVGVNVLTCGLDQLRIVQSTESRELVPGRHRKMSLLKRRSGNGDDGSGAASIAGTARMVCCNRADKRKRDDARR